MKKIIILACLSLLSLTAATASVKKVAAGGNLASTLKKSTAADTIMLASGSFKLEGTLPVTRNIVIMGEPGARPKVSVSSFFIRTGAQHLVLENLDLTINRKYLVSNEANIEIDIDLIAIHNCTVNFDGGEGACLVAGVSANENRNRIGEILVDDCIIYNGGFPTHIIFNAGSASKTKVEKITLRNSTIANTARGLIATNVPSDAQVTISDCTFYALNKTNNEAGTIRMGNSAVKVDITNSIFNFAGDKSKFIVVGSGSSFNVTDSYVTNEIARIPGANGLKTTPVNAAGTFEAPADNPTAPGVSFRVKGPSLGKPGDPRWYK